MGFVFLCRLTTLAPALYHVLVHQSRCLTQTSFRFRVATDTLVFGCSLPVIRAALGLAPVRVCPCWANINGEVAPFRGMQSRRFSAFILPQKTISRLRNRGTNAERCKGEPFRLPRQRVLGERRNSSEPLRIQACCRASRRHLTMPDDRRC